MKRITAIILIIMLCIPCFACKGRGLKRYETLFYDGFDTVTQVIVYETDERAAKACFDETHSLLTRYHRLFDIYHEYEGLTNLCTVNRLAGVEPVAVDPELIAFLQSAKELSGLTGGRMNIAMGSILALWHDAREQGLADPQHAALPSMEALRDAAAHCDPESLVLDPEAGTVRFSDPDLRLDVGAVAKGYAAQRVAETLENQGVSSLLISIGGNVSAIGARGDGEDWKVGVQDPEGEGFLCEVCVNGKSLVTSGSYQRYYTVDGKRYHHIIDPATLMPAERYASVSVLSADSGLADALSTALFNMDLPEGQALVSSLADTEALWVASDGTRTVSDGFPAEFLED